MILVEFLSQPEVLAGIFTILGGLALKGIEKWLARGTDRRDDRKDYRDEIRELRDSLDEEEKQNQYWRHRFYEEQEDNATLRIMMIQAGITPPTKRVEPPDDSVL